MLHRKYVNPPPYPNKRGIGCILTYHTFKVTALNRKGAGKEEEYLMKLFNEWSLEIHTYRDLTMKELENLLSGVSGRSGNSVFPTVEDRHKILVIVISSHGGEDYILCSDMERITHFDITSYFNPLIFKCDIPRLFIFNNCRKASIVQQAWTEEVILPSNWQNFIILHLCRRGTISYRSTKEGSLCLKELYNCYLLYGRNMDLQSFIEKFTIEVEISVLQLTSKKGRLCTQHPTYKSTLRERFFFSLPEKMIYFDTSPIPVSEGKLLSEHRRVIETPGVDMEEMEREEPTLNPYP